MNIPEIFASLVFTDEVMQARLPKTTYRAMKKCIAEGKRLDREIADVVANAMKEWAIEKGATHYTHWFQPMTGITAEKHDSFISPNGDGKVIMEFSGRELSQGETDGSSFPSGGLRATFEARGYTAWDPNSYAFIKDHTLCIPTAFCSYGGQALDKKTPLLRSMEALNKQALRVLRLFGDHETAKVTPTVGAEQEYFLIDKDVYLKRKDLIYCGRTLFGAKAPKGQELDDHYFGAIKTRVLDFMSDLDEELWKLGVTAKTEHNEVAPGQHELAPVFCTTNLACDQNQITMELMKKIADKHNLVCLLHEKPFAGVNGSGKHNNWSLSTDKGVNLLEPGDSPMENAQFLTFLIALVKGVDEYQDLMRCSVASASNDHRLGGQEAPPAILSIFLGDELTDILDSIENDSAYSGKDKELMKLGVHTLPKFFRDTTDRNRTSPLAFTGNKFEFRMLGSSVNIACPNFFMNTIMAEELCQFADELEQSDDFAGTLHAMLKREIKNHKRIIFNGNNYSDEWVEEAERRGLLNLKTSVEALESYSKEKNIRLFGKHRVLSKEEVFSRRDILLENYVKTINIEALTMLDMSKRSILPAVSGYVKTLADTILAKKSVSSAIDCKAEEGLVNKLSALSGCFCEKIEMLEKAVVGARTQQDIGAEAAYYRDYVLPVMKEMRAVSDEMETMVDAKVWPFPTYGELLFSVL